MSSLFNSLLSINSFPWCGFKEGKDVVADRVMMDQLISTNGEFLTDSHPVIQYLFNDLEVYFPDLKRVLDLRVVYDMMNQIAEPFYSQFMETTDHAEFLRIANSFFFSAFGKGSVWVGGYSYEELMESCDGEESSLERLEEFADGEVHFQLFFREPGSEPRFTHLETTLQFEILDGKTELVKFTWGRPEETPISFRGFRYVARVLEQEQKFQDMINASMKRILVATDSITMFDENKANEVNQQVSRPSLTYTQNEAVAIRECAILPSMELKEFISANLMVRDRWLSDLGIVANLNPKMERLTTGENYKDIVSVADRQRATMNNLKYFASQVEKKFGETLEFDISKIMPREEAAAEDPMQSVSGSSGVHGM